MRGFSHCEPTKAHCLIVRESGQGRQFHLWLPQLFSP
jgi:hypothetical protein